MKHSVATLFLFLIFSSSLDAQTLDRLYERTTKFCALRISGDRTEEAKYIEPQGLLEFMSNSEMPITKAEVTSIEFSDSPGVVTVVSKLQMTLPVVGPFERIARESWVWNGTDWFLHVEPLQNKKLFEAKAATASNEAPNTNLKIEFLEHEVDLGRHFQGEIIPGQLEFRGDPKTILAVRPADLQGLTFDPVKWQAPDMGVLKFTLDTALMSEPFQKSLRFDFVDMAGGLHTTTITMRAAIEGRVRFAQIPKAVDTRSNGVCVLQIQNLSSKPIRLLGASITNNDFRLDSDSPGIIGPHEVGTIKMSYSASAQGAGASLNLTFAEDILGKRTVVVPLQFVAAPSAPSTYTREELDAIQKKAKQP